MSCYYIEQFCTVTPICQMLYTVLCSPAVSLYCIAINSSVMTSLLKTMSSTMKQRFWWPLCLRSCSCLFLCSSQVSCVMRQRFECPKLHLNIKYMATLYVLSHIIQIFRRVEAGREGPQGLTDVNDWELLLRARAVNT